MPNQSNPTTHKKRSSKKKRVKNVINPFSRKFLKEDDIVQISGVPNKKHTKTVGFSKTHENVDGKKALAHLCKVNLLSRLDKSSKSTKNDNDSVILTNKSIHSHCDNGEVKRLYSPFNRFSNKSKINRSKMTPYQSQYSHVGLSPREKSYLIFSCQSRSSRYQILKSLAATAMKNNKIFMIRGRCKTVRNALIERGWVEKIPPNKMNLSKIRNGSFSNEDDIHKELERLLLSNFVEKCPPSFIWQSTGDYHDTTTIDMSSETNAVVNKLQVDATWTTKHGLCSSMKRNYWFYIENVAEVTGPRTYNCSNYGEKEGFLKDYQITACTSLLKWIVSMVANERPIFVDTGNIPMSVMVFALNRCKEYLYIKQNKDIDRTINTASNGQWNTFMKKYNSIIAKQDVFESDKSNKLPLYLSYAKFLLKEIHKYRPQLSCEGCHNIWIIKPAHCSRGRGITLASKLTVITRLLEKANAKYVIQKYIEEPLLIHETKFDIRQYYLVTSTYPLVIWMYRDCYLKFSSQKYNIKNYHESIHLTNNAVQRKYENCTARNPDLPQYNMWELDKYKQYLCKIGKDKVWDNIIYPGMRKCIVGIMLSCQDSLSVSKNRFELYGCDFILDKVYEPWLIEINSCPDLNPTTQVTAKICPAVVLDIVKVVIDRAHNSKASTGKFECIYHQPMTLPRYGIAADLVVQGFALKPEYFYKGKLKLDNYYGNVDISEEPDIQTLLNDLKQKYDNDIMVEPEDELIEEKKDAFGQNTESELDLSMDVCAVNDQIEKLIDRVISEHSSSSNCSSDSPQLIEPHANISDESLTLIQTTKSEIGLNSLMKTASHFTSVDNISIKGSFKFSELEEVEDTPLAVKTSSFGFEHLKHAIRRTALAINSTSEKCESYEELLEATMKIMTFIDKKEKEH